MLITFHTLGLQLQHAISTATFECPIAAIVDALVRSHRHEMFSHSVLYFSECLFRLRDFSPAPQFPMCFFVLFNDDNCILVHNVESCSLRSVNICLVFPSFFSQAKIFLYVVKLFCLTIGKERKIRKKTFRGKFDQAFVPF